MKTALVIATYNWKEALYLVLQSIKRQTVFPDEIIIADDGSREDTKLVIDKFREEINIPVKHIWQEDLGYNKTKIVNKAIAASTSDYIIQLDGDCILSRTLVEDHVKNAQKNTYLYGTRANILPQYVEEVFQNEKISFNFFSKEIKNRTRTLHIPILAKLYKPHSGVSNKVRGCNYSFWKKDFFDVNGYSEDFEGWGLDDSDLVIRLNNKGVKGRRLRYIGVVFHIYHKTSSRNTVNAKEKALQDYIKNKTIRCIKGVNQYISKD